MRAKVSGQGERWGVRGPRWGNDLKWKNNNKDSLGPVEVQWYKCTVEVHFGSNCVQFCVQQCIWFYRHWPPECPKFPVLRLHSAKNQYYSIGGYTSKFLLSWYCILSPKLFVSHYWLCFTSKYSCSTQQILFSNNWHVATKAASSNPQSVRASSASCLASEKRLGVAGGYPLLFLLKLVAFDLIKIACHFADF